MNTSGIGLERVEETKKTLCSVRRLTPVDRKAIASRSPQTPTTRHIKSPISSPSQRLAAASRSSPQMRPSPTEKALIEKLDIALSSMQKHEERIKELERENVFLKEIRKNPSDRFITTKLTPNKMVLHLAGYRKPAGEKSYSNSDN